MTTNGIMGIMENLLGTANNTTPKKAEGAESGISFGHYLKRQGVNHGGEKPALNKDEEKLLEKSLVYLLNYKMALGQAEKNADLKKSLQKMGQDTDFINSLPKDLKATLLKILRQLQDGGSAETMAANRKDIDALMKHWDKRQADKKQKNLSEVDDLIAAIQEKLASAGIQVKAQTVEKDGKKEVQVSFLVDKLGKDSAFTQSLTGKMRTASTQKADGEAGLDGQVVAKSLLNRISAFLNGSDGTLEKANLSKQTVDLREDLKKYLKRENQPLSWIRDQIAHTAQQNSLQQLGDSKVEKAIAHESATAPAEQMMKEETKAVNPGKVLAAAEEKTVQKDGKQNDPFAKALNGVEVSTHEFKNPEAPRTKEAPLASYVPEPNELFQQMIDKFRMDVRPGLTQMEIKLYPEELGTMHLKLSVEKGIVNAHILTENARVKELIEQNLSELKETFAQEGIQWDQITVDVNQDSMRENPFAYQPQSNMRDQQHSNRRQNFRESLTDEMMVEPVGGEEGTPAATEPAKESDRLIDYLA